MCVRMRVYTWGECLLSAEVIVSRLSNVPCGEGQLLHVLQTVELQHVHVAAAALVSGDEAAFTRFKHVFDDFLSAHLIMHAEKHCNPLTGHIPGVIEELEQEQRIQH